MPAPHEVVATPLTIYLADVGTAFPDIDVAAAGLETLGWDVLGTEGDLNINEGGVTVGHSEEVNDWTPAGATMPRKRFRTAEATLISFELVDIGPTAYAKVMNDAQVTQTPQSAGVPGESFFSLYRGDQVAQFAVLARGMSPVDNALVEQYEISKAFVSVNGDVVYDKGTPAFLPVEILAVRTSDSDVIGLRIQETVAGT